MSSQQKFKDSVLLWSLHWSLWNIHKIKTSPHTQPLSLSCYHYFPLPVITLDLLHENGFKMLSFFGRFCVFVELHNIRNIRTRTYTHQTPKNKQIQQQTKNKIRLSIQLLIQSVLMEYFHAAFRIRNFPLTFQSESCQQKLGHFIMMVNPIIHGQYGNTSNHFFFRGHGRCFVGLNEYYKIIR